MFKVTLKVTTTSIGILGCLASAQSWAQQAAPSGNAMATIEVTAPRLARELYATPAAVSTLDQEAIAQGQQRTRLDEALVRVPGVFCKTAITLLRDSESLYAALVPGRRLACAALQ